MTNRKKISLSRSQDIPFDKLVMSERNVRHVRAGISIEELAEDIARRTLLQSLSVRPVTDDDDQETGRYEVQAGGRRYRALEYLVKQKRLAKNAAIPCVIREDGLLEEDSLAENVQRINLHPLDQFRAFQTLSEKGLSAEDIAARFFVTAKIVRQRLKLASVTPKLLDLYAEEELTLEQLMAFSVTDDQARQEQVWDIVRQAYNQEPYYIRRLLTEDTVRVTDKRVRFVGLEAYEDAGGVVMRDLFSQVDEGWLQDVALLEKLVATGLDAERDAIADEGWKWIEVAVDFPYGHTIGLERITGEVEPLSEDETAQQDALRNELAGIEERYSVDQDEDLPENVDKCLGEIEAELEAFDTRAVLYAPDDIAKAGVFISLESDGSVRIERGFVKPEDQEQDDDTVDPDQSGDPQTGDEDNDAGNAPDTDIDGADEPDEPRAKPLSDRLVLELTAYRTLALRNALAGDPDVAFLAALHVLVLQSFYHFGSGSCLQITLKSSGFSVQPPDLNDSPAASDIAARHENWERQMPGDPDDLWAALCDMDTDSRMALFAHCVSLTLYAVSEPWNRHSDAVRHADILADVLKLDMAASGWKPSADNYLSRVPKNRILEAVTEAQGADAAQRIDHLKKGDMVREAEQLLIDTGWVPEPLRTPELEPQTQTASEHEQDDASSEPAATAAE
ncbi:ParB/RepB/Spo0J family partition protein [Thalassospira xiamenensis]|uniref:DNA-binding protein n=1 Tax=Thalassospira xiamenensis TaxID=220697 RepID=A0A367XB50_9PROT|nr:ParB/RepB/Spo0J family partition protein [Thalassospira xiamenensis]KZB56362.1 DNA-binding protein [Thalassospira xiamenensis]MCK2167192.1 ParB/RepB/Spo0J family partition protein [Thalassospira xiamenensis]RCK50001.1 DNA-binding protein [Thalassospira xiamenensis]